MFIFLRKYLQKRRQKRLEVDLAKCLNRMINNALGLEELDLVLSEEQIETMKVTRRVLMVLKTYIPNTKPLGLTAALTEIKALSRAEGEKKVTATDKEKEKKGE